MCTPCNTCFLGPNANPNPQPKRRLDRFSHFCAAHGSVVGHARACPFPEKLRLCMQRPRLLSNTWFLGPSRVRIPNGISSGSAVFAQRTAESRYTLQRAALSPLNLPLSAGDLNLHLTCFLEPTRVLTPNGISIDSAGFAGLTSVIDRETDRQITLFGL